MKAIVSFLIVLGMLIMPTLGHAKDWPDRDVRLIVPYPAGGSADVIARLVAQGLQDYLHEPFVVENKAGAGGTIGSLQVVRSAPDGYTILFAANGPILFSPELIKPVPYSWQADMAPVSSVSMTPLVVLVNPNSPIKTFADFVAYAKKNGDKLTYAGAGMGTINHLFSELMQQRLKVKWTTVQYKGAAPALTDLIGGHVGFGIDQLAHASNFVTQGTLRALAVTSDSRSRALPDVPTLTELGYPELVSYTFTAIMAPKKTPKPIVEKMHNAFDAVLKSERVRAAIEKSGADVVTMPVDKFEAFLDRETTTWTPIVRRLNAH